MDTRKWGPGGWRLLHYIALEYDKKDKPNKQHYIRFFNNIQHILPCKYCRISFKEYISEERFNYDNASKWLYKIHNSVNKKLQKQGYNKNPNPNLSFVMTNIELEYDKIQNQSKITKIDKMIDTFISSIIYNYDNLQNKNKNTRRVYTTFFTLLGKLHPNKKFKEKYKKNPITHDDLNNVQSLARWYQTIDVINKSLTERRKDVLKNIAVCTNNTCRSQKKK